MPKQPQRPGPQVKTPGQAPATPNDNPPAASLQHALRNSAAQANRAKKIAN